MRKLSGISMLALAGSMVSFVGAAHAQDGGVGSADEQADGGGKLTTIVVSATKREQDLQSVPISITALDSKAIDRIGAVSLRELEYVVPNFNYSGNDFNRRPDITLRGITAAVRNPGEDGSIGFYVDGIFMARPTDWNQDLSDLERVEVLRGPQGTLFGKNTIAGALLFTTKKPGTDFGGSISAEYGDYDSRRLRAAVDLPLVDGLLYSRASFSYFKRDGYVSNTAGPAHQNEDRIGGRLQFRLTPADNLTIDLSGDMMSENPRRFGRELLVPTAGTGYVPGPNTIALDRTSLNDRDLWGVSATVEADFDGYTLTSITSYRETEVAFEFDEDHGPEDILRTRIVDNNNNFSQEIRFASPTGRTFDFLVGAYYLNSYHEQGGGYIQHGEDDPRFPGLTRAFRAADVTSYAVFSNFNLNFTDQFTLNAGLRVGYEEKHLQFKRTNEDGGFLGGAFPNFPVDGTYVDDINDTDVSPTVGLNYQINDDNLAYVKWSRGNKSGGWNSGLGYSGQPPFNAEQVDNYEIGLKSEFLDNRARVNLAAFVMDYRDLQVTTFAGLETGNPFTVTNAAKASIKGFEADMAFTPVDGLEITSGIGFLDSEYKNYQVSATVDYNGNRLARAPRWNGNLSAEYKFAASEGLDVFISGAWTYRGGMFTEADNRVASYVPSYSLFNARAGIGSADGSWEASVWVKNIGDKAYLVDRNSFSPGGDFGIYGAPRMWGGSIQYRF